MIHYIMFFAMLAIGMASPIHDATVKYCEAFKHYGTNPDAVKELLADDAVSCVNGDCLPWVAKYDGMFQAVAKFDYTYEIITTGESQAVARCFNYLETKNGCSSMFMLTDVMTFNADNKITKTELIAPPSELQKVMKCFAPPVAEL